MAGRVGRGGVRAVGRHVASPPRPAQAALAPPPTPAGRALGGRGGGVVVHRLRDGRLDASDPRRRTTRPRGGRRLGPPARPRRGGLRCPARARRAPPPGRAVWPTET